MNSRFIPILVNLLSILGFILGTIRIFTLVLHTPVLGYANNFDMIRMQACLQIWPADPNIPAGDAFFSAPLNEYSLREVERFKNLCIPSSDLIFGYMGKFIVQVLHLSTFSIKIFGVIRASVVAIMVFSFLWAFLRRAEQTAGLILSLVYLLVIADPANTSYFNTFYYEASTLFFACLSILLCWYISIRNENLFLGIFLAGSLLFLGLSKPQHIFLPCAIVLGLVVANWHRLPSIKHAFFLALFCLGINFTYYGVYQKFYAQPGAYMYYINYANATDTFLGAILPSTNDPYQAAYILGLPTHCVEHSGKTWYTAGIQENHPCPEVLSVPRFRIAFLVLRQPGFLVRATSQGILLLRPWTLRHIGGIGNQQSGYVGELFFTVSDWFDNISDRIVKVLFLLPGVAGILGVIVSYSRKSTENTRSLATIVILIVASLYTVFYSSLFGDGYIEFQKHTYLYFSLYLSLVIILCIVALKSIWHAAERIIGSGHSMSWNQRVIA